jgi:undecaprenyl phosphate N,N'-diacetylbacillosamine 1-phosphate transferase
MKPYIKVKRVLDIIFSIVLLVLMSPIMICVAIAIKIDSKGPVFFKQDRLGLNGKPFKIYKFRSMVVNAEKSGTGVYSYKGDPRVTRLGAIIRKTSIDEFPQLFNIFKGEMSFIGPRPTLIYHPWPIDQYTEEQKKRFNIRPGVTGLAQINGRKELPWPDRIILDIDYINKVSILLDLKIFIITIFKIFKMAENYNTSQTVKSASNPGNHKDKNNNK